MKKAKTIQATWNDSNNSDGEGSDNYLNNFIGASSIGCSSSSYEFVSENIVINDEACRWNDN